MKLVRDLLPCLICLALASSASGTTIHGVDFTDLELVEVPASTNLTLTTSDDVYVYVPIGLVADEVFLNAAVSIIFDASADLTANHAAACTGPNCPDASFGLDRDVLLRVVEPLADLSVTAGGSIVVSALPIPEPSTAPLLGLGLLGIGSTSCRRGWPHRIPRNSRIPVG
jgi:hypothetical protein